MHFIITIKVCSRKANYELWRISVNVNHEAIWWLTLRWGCIKLSMTRNPGAGKNWIGWGRSWWRGPARGEGGLFMWCVIWTHMCYVSAIKLYYDYSRTMSQRGEAASGKSLGSTDHVGAKLDTMVWTGWLTQHMLTLKTLPYKSSHKWCTCTVLDSEAHWYF